MAAQTNFINSLLEAAFNGDTYTGGTIQMGLFTGSVPSMGGIEVSGGGYARQTLTFGAATSKRITTAADATFADLPTSQTIMAVGIYDGATLIDEKTLSTPFTSDINNNQLDISYYFEIPGS